MFKKIINLFKNTHTIKTPEPSIPVENFNFTEGVIKVDDIFSISGRGIVLAGKVLSGGLAVGFEADGEVVIKGIELFDKQKQFAVGGDQVGILINIGDKELVEIFLAEQNNNTIIFQKK